MTGQARGADALVRALEAAGVERIFTLSGNHIMEVFDALCGSSISLVHTRHEAAAVHMADAYARLTGKVGVAMVTGGQGHANAVAALPTALAGEVPVLLLSGHAPLAELGNGAFQELPQAALATPVAKAAWTAQSAAGLGGDVARAISVALSGRPGPVHLSLPTDVLEAKLEAPPPPPAAAFAPAAMPLPATTARLVAEAIAGAARPLLLAPPALCTPAGMAALAALEATCGLPAMAMNSPRGLADPSLGAFTELLPEADLVVLLGKPLDFTTRFGRTAPGARFIALEPDGALIGRAQRLLGERLLFGAVADAMASVTALAGAVRRVAAQGAWAARVAETLAWRPPGPRWLARRTGRSIPPRSATPSTTRWAPSGMPPSSAMAGRWGSGAPPSSGRRGASPMAWQVPSASGCPSPLARARRWRGRRWR
jgi:acetolactate synthase-1/2/3 large subunit